MSNSNRPPPPPTVLPVPLSYPDEWKKAPPDRRELRKRRQLERNHVSEADILVVLEHDKERRAAAEALRDLVPQIGVPGLAAFWGAFVDLLQNL